MTSPTYLAGGYFLSCAVDTTPRCVRLPRHVTLGSDHSPRRFFLDTAFLSWTGKEPGEREEYAAAFHLDADRMTAVTAWADEHFDEDFGAWSVIFDLPTARFIAAEFLSGCAGLELWGIGLPAELAERFLDQTRPPPPTPGFAPIGAGGVHRALVARQPLAEGGAPLGHEVLACEMYGCLQSLQSRHLDEAEILLSGGTTPNALGLIDSLPDAFRVAAAAPALGASPGWPEVDWMPWLLMRYGIAG